MGTLDVTKFGVRELDAREMAEVEGGCIPLIVAGVVIVGLMLLPKKAY